MALQLKSEIWDGNQWVPTDLEQLKYCDETELRIIIEDLCLEIQRLKVAAAETAPTDSI